jgi:hypothetical protein
MLKWIRSDQEPIRQAIEISSEWKDLNLLEDDNYAMLDRAFHFFN